MFDILMSAFPFYFIVKTNFMLNKALFVSFLLIIFFGEPVKSQTPVFGTTIITHGYQPSFSSAPIKPGDWAYRMAEAIIGRSGGEGCIRVYEKATGEFETDSQYSNCSGGETILLFNWAEESNIFEKGYSEAAGDALFSALIAARNNGVSLSNLHFIGHSRGAVVNTECVLRLLSIDIDVDHVTNLDPHDWGASNSATDFDNHPELPALSVFNISHPGVVAWEKVNFYDTYYQDNGFEWNTGNQDCGTCIGGLEGRTVAGSKDHLWNYNGSVVICHTNIQDCAYSTTISNINNALQGGYTYARLGGRVQRNNNLDERTLIAPSFDFFKRRIAPSQNINRVQGIVNGSFDRGSNRNIPGWEEHGGGGNGVIVRRNNKPSLLLAGSQNKRSHNRLVIPPNAKSIQFLMDVFLPNPMSILVIKLRNKVRNKEIFRDTLNKSSNGFLLKQTKDISEFAGQVGVLEVEVSNGVSATVYLTDFEFSDKTNTSTLFLFDLSGSMNENGGGTIPKIEQAKAASKITIDGMQSGNQGVTNQVAVYGFSGGCVPDPTIEVSPFTDDLITVQRQINSMFADGGTPLDNAIRAAECKMAAHLLKEGQQKGKLIILSDGQGTCGNIRPPGVYNSAPLQRNRSVIVDASQCGFSNSANVGVSYYTVGFNIPPGSPAERDLQYLSQISGGKYLNVQNQTQLVRAFRKFNRIYLPKESPALAGLPAPSVSNFTKGVTQIKEECFDEALGVYTAFAKQHSADCHGAYNLALVQEANDFYKEAINNYQKYLSLCPNPPDQGFVEKQIAFLEEEFREFVLFQKEVIRSDLDFLNLHYQKIQNGQSIALAEEFKGFLREKNDYYEKLPRLIDNNSSQFKNQTEDIASALKECAMLIRRNPQTWDRDGASIIARTSANLEELLEEM